MSNLRKDQTEPVLSEDRYLRILDTITDGCQIISPEWRYLYVNKAAAIHGNQTKKKLLGSKLMDLYPGFERTEVFRVMRWCMENREQHSMQNEFTYPDNTKKWFSLNIQPDPEGLFITTVDITERKQQEEALIRSKKILDATGRMAKVGGWELDAKKMEVTWTDETYRIHELPLDFAPSLEDAIRFFHPDDRTDIEKAIQRALDKGEPYDMELRFITATGKHLLTRTQCEPEIIDGEIVKLKGTFQDITERKQAEEALRVSEARYRRLAENSPDAIYRMSLPDGEYEYISSAAANIFGYPPDAWYKKPFLIQEVIHPDWHAYLKEQWEQLLTGHVVPPAYEYQIIHKNGDIRWVNQRNMPVKDTDGRLIAIEGIVTDISDRKQNEETLRKSHERFLTVLNSIDATIYVTDMQSYEVLFMNKNMINSLGRDMTGEICWKVFREESEPCSHCLVEKLLDDNGNPTGVYTWQDQSPITGKWYTNYDRAIEWTDGRLVKIQIATDITEMKLVEGQLRQAHKMESIGTLAGGIAHEFNNMLSIILGNTELAFDDIPDWNPARENLNEIKTASLRAKDVVRKLLSAARKTPESRKPIQLSTTMKESLDFLRKTIPTTIDIRTEIACSTEMILGDPAEINEVMIHLCTNSVHAMTDENGFLEVGLNTKKLNRESALHYENLKPGDYISLTVKDAGEGIDPAFMDRLFDPYFTTKDVDKGLGLGLSIVHGIVKKHDGAIRIESEIGKETIVEILFPLIEEQTKTETEEFETQHMATERILLVDDEPLIMKMVTQMLKRSGYKVIGKTSSSSALKAFKESPEQFDLVISDMTMPEMAGDQLAQEIKQIRPDIPVILCTGHSGRIDECKAKKLGIEAFMMKPFSRKDIAKTIPEVLGKTKGPLQKELS